MKKILLFLTAVVLLSGLNGCKKVGEKVDKILTFYVSDDYSFQLPAVSPFLVNQTVAVPFQTSTDATAEYKAANTAANLVKDVKLDQLTLAVTGPSGATFDFLKSVNFYMSTDYAGTDKVQMASMADVPLGVSTITLVPYEHNLDKFLKAQSYYLTVEPTFRAGTTQQTDMRINYRFKITADPL